MKKADVLNGIIKNYFLYHINGQLYHHIILNIKKKKNPKLTCSQQVTQKSNSNTKTNSPKKKKKNHVSKRNVLIYPINKRKEKKSSLKFFPENKHGLIKLKGLILCDPFGFFR